MPGAPSHMRRLLAFAALHPTPASGDKISRKGLQVAGVSGLPMAALDQRVPSFEPQMRPLAFCSSARHIPVVSLPDNVW